MEDMSLSAAYRLGLWLLVWVISVPLADGATDERSGPITVSYGDAQCLKYSYRMTMNLGSTSKTRSFGLKSEVLVHVKQQNPDGSWLLELQLSEPRRLYETSSGYLAAMPAEKSLRHKLGKEFFIVHSKAGVIDTVYYPASDDQEAVAIKKGVASCLNLNLSLSHQPSYHTHDIDDVGWHTGFVTVSDGRTPGTFVVSKQHGHEHYHRFSHENTLPGSRKENRRHVITLANNSMIESSSKDYAGRLPEDKNFKSNLPDGLKFRGEGSLRLEGHCSSESVRTRRSDTDVGTLVKDSLPTSIKHEYVQWSKVENLGRDRETYDSRSVEYLMDCINEEQSEKVVEQCVHALIRRFKDDGADARRAISFICQHENPRSFRWPYLVQSLGVSKTGQHCLADLLRNSTLTHDDQLRVIKGTHLVTEVDESLVDSLISFTRPGPSHSNFTSRLSAIVSLGLVTGAGRPSAQITDRVLNHLHSSLYQCPERDYDARASQFIDYVELWNSDAANGSRMAVGTEG
ncbi:uncharacterized protein LOC134185237 [Corticium candelabrum]|uniref:uncharacterized protein LOC134185237 n=1 Tax=Corticium candelabrum TaxID=121492 RepID=UPI002E273FA1|nr:uncharacterized protein LOC134185237 [Corticium candelabrum]